MELSICPFLCHANRLARAQNRQAYVHVVGLGLGVWQVDPVQVEDQLSVYARVLEQEQFEHIADLDFSWFGSATTCGGRGHGDKLHGVTLHFSKRNVADPLPGDSPAFRLFLLTVCSWFVVRMRATKMSL